MQNILINEVHPNPNDGHEWIELYLNEDNEADSMLENYSLFDSTRQIHLFTNEQFVNQFLVVEVSGLNNDADQVLLKNSLGEIVDEMAYQSTQKAQSWSRIENSTQFVLSPATAWTENFSSQITPTSSISPTPSTSATPSYTLSPTPTNVKKSNEDPNSLVTTEEKKIQNIKSTTQNTKLKKWFVENYHLEQIQLIDPQKPHQEKLLRLVILGQNLVKEPTINAIIGGLLIISASLLLLYVKIKNKHF